MKKSNKLPIKKQEEIAENLKNLRVAAKYTQEGIAQKLGCTAKTYRSWEVGVYDGKTDTKYYPAIEYDDLFKLADIYRVSIDYLLCRSKCTSVENHYISQKTGLSDEAIKRIASANGNTPNQFFLNSFILSEEYLEIKHSMSLIKNDCGNIEYYYPIFKKTESTIKKTKDRKKAFALENMLENYGNHLEHNGQQIQSLIYQCALSFGNYLIRIKKSWGHEVHATIDPLENPLPGLDITKK